MLLYKLFIHVLNALISWINALRVNAIKAFYKAVYILSNQLVHVNRALVMYFPQGMVYQHTYNYSVALKLIL